MATREPSARRSSIALAPSRIEVASHACNIGRDSSLVGRLDFKSSRGREPVLGGFDSHSLPPLSPESRGVSMPVTFLDQLRDAAEAQARAEGDYRDESRRQLAALALER